MKLKFDKSFVYLLFWKFSYWKCIKNSSGWFERVAENHVWAGNWPENLNLASYRKRIENSSGWLEGVAFNHVCAGN